MHTLLVLLFKQTFYDISSVHECVCMCENESKWDYFFLVQLRFCSLKKIEFLLGEILVWMLSHTSHLKIHATQSCRRYKKHRKIKHPKICCCCWSYFEASKFSNWKKKMPTRKKTVWNLKNVNLLFHLQTRNVQCVVLDLNQSSNWEYTHSKRCLLSSVHRVKNNNKQTNCIWAKCK